MSCRHPVYKQQDGKHRAGKRRMLCAYGTGTARELPVGRPELSPDQGFNGIDIVNKGRGMEPHAIWQMPHGIIGMPEATTELDKMEWAITYLPSSVNGSP